MSLVWRNIKQRQEYILSLIKAGKIICCFDCETTGLKEEDKIIQFSASRYKINDDLNIKKIDLMNVYINPQEKLTEKIIEITGITDEMLRYAPYEEEICNKIFSYINDSDIWIGYNVKFDIEKIFTMAKRQNKEIEKKYTIDVLEMARDFCDQNIMPDYKLGTVTEYLFPEETFNFHDAHEDIKATMLVFDELLRSYRTIDTKISKVPVHLEKASLFINPKQKSQQRVRLHIAGDYDIGAIYYDIVKKVWSCKTNTSSKRLFNSCDMEDLEKQFMNMYGYRFGYNSVDEVAKSWIKFKREANKKETVNN